MIVVNAVGSWQVNQILIPYRKENVALKIQTISAIVSILLNIILVPKISYIGAAIAWCITESMLVIMEAIAINRECKDIRIQYITSILFSFVLILF